MRCTAGVRSDRHPPDLHARVETALPSPLTRAVLSRQTHVLRNTPHARSRYPVLVPAPVRTCIGCRTRDEKTQLLRVVAHDAGVEIDIRQVLPGRGAYLHPRPGCLEQALRRRSLGSALRSEIDGQQAAVKIRQLLSALT
jgi:uncharacterized protein